MDKDAINRAFDEIDADLAANPMKGAPAKEDLPRLDADQLDWAGTLLFGRNWKTEMAEVMDWRDPARIRAMMRGARPIPAGATKEILGFLRSRAEECAELADEIEAMIRAHREAQAQEAS